MYSASDCWLNGISVARSVELGHRDVEDVAAGDGPFVAFVGEHGGADEGRVGLGSFAGGATDGPLLAVNGEAQQLEGLAGAGVDTAGGLEVPGGGVAALVGQLAVLGPV